MTAALALQRYGHEMTGIITLDKPVAAFAVQDTVAGPDKDRAVAPLNEVDDAAVRS